MTVRVLHLLPRCSGGGPERSLLAAIGNAPAHPPLDHTIAVLEGSVAPALYLAARRSGARVIVHPDGEALRAAAEEVDVVMVHYWNQPRLLATLAGLLLGPSRIIVWVHVLGVHRPQVITADLARWADVLVLTSEVSRGAPGLAAATTMRTVPGIADMGRLEGFAPLPHDGVVVGYIGVVNDAKMHPRLAEMSAMARHPDLRFVVRGAGGGEDALRDRADRAGLGDRFVVAGYTDDIRSALATVDVFGYPLCADTYATSEKALQEAMWVGIPPVVFPHGGLADLVEDGVTGLVATTERQYAGALDRLAADPALRDRLGTAARRATRDRFDPVRLAASWVGSIAEAAASARRDRPPLHDGLHGAALFVAALGDEAGPFATALRAGPDRPNADADAEIAGATAVVVGGEGGIVHYRNTWPDDPLLRRWTALTAQAAGRHKDAEAEFRAAERLTGGASAGTDGER